MSITATAPAILEPVPDTPYREGWSIGAHPVTYSEQARPVEIAGTTELHWHGVKDGRQRMSSTDRDWVVKTIDEHIDANRIVPVSFLDVPRPMRVPARVRDTALGLNTYGLVVAESDGITYCMTPCCFADETGTESGIACRGCYGDVPDGMWDTTVVHPILTRTQGYLPTDRDDVTEWLATERKGKHRSMTNREWLRGLGADQECRKRTEDGVPAIYGPIGLRVEVPAFIYDAAELPVIRYASDPTD